MPIQNGASDSINRQGDLVRKGLPNREKSFVDRSTREQDAAIKRAMEWLLRREMAPSDACLERDFQQWLAAAEVNRQAYAAIQSTWAELGQLPGQLPGHLPGHLPGEFPRKHAADNETSGNVVHLPVRHLPVRKPRRPRWVAAAAALAAACVALVAVPLIHRHIVTDYETGVAELRDVALPDGSIVQLDAGSAIAVDYTDAARQVTLLSGQAFFQVTRDTQRPFSVLADEVSVTVTGTAFSVWKTTGTIDVSVQSGTVEVLHDGKRAGDPLTVGDRLVIDRLDKAIHRERMAPESVAAWRLQKLVVQDTTFGDIVEAVGRYLPGAIFVGDRTLNQRKITGVFDLNRPVDALRTLANSQNASVTEITPYLLLISGR